MNLGVPVVTKNKRKAFSKYGKINHFANIFCAKDRNETQYMQYPKVLLVPEKKIQTILMKKWVSCMSLQYGIFTAIKDLALNEVSVFVAAIKTKW